MTKAQSNPDPPIYANKNILEEQGHFTVVNLSFLIPSEILARLYFIDP